MVSRTGFSKRTSGRPTRRAPQGYVDHTTITPLVRSASLARNTPGGNVTFIPPERLVSLRQGAMRGEISPLKSLPSAVVTRKDFELESLVFILSSMASCTSTGKRAQLDVITATSLA